VESLSVRLVSCHEVKPRRRRNVSDLSSSKAFRLCISCVVMNDDHDRLLDADKWPAYVGISDWIFKPSNVDGESSKRQKTNDQRNEQLLESVAAAAAAAAISLLQNACCVKLSFQCGH